MPKLFGYYAKRYADRPGGYTRIHRTGNRYGDNAPSAILELVDNPRDIKLEMTARAVGWELLKEKIQSKDVSELIRNGVDGVDALVLKELDLKPKEAGQLRPNTRWNLQKVMKYRDSAALAHIVEKAEDHVVRSSFRTRPIHIRVLTFPPGSSASKACSDKGNIGGHGIEGPNPEIERRREKGEDDPF